METDTVPPVPKLPPPPRPNRDPPPPPPPKTPDTPPAPPTTHSTSTPLRKLQKPEPVMKPLPFPRREPATNSTSPVQTQFEARRSRNSSLLNTLSSEGAHGRSVSTPISSRPISYHSEGESVSPGGHRVQKTRSWIGGGRKSRNASTEDLSGVRSDAWVNAGSHKIDYNLSMLTNGDKVPELWDESADTFVYLFPQASGRGPSFRVPSMVLSSSYILMQYIQENAGIGRARGKSFDGRASLSINDATRNIAIRGLTPPYTPNASTTDSQSTQSNSDGQADTLATLNFDGPRDIHLYFPTGSTTDGTNLTADDIQALVDIRNLFAFLTGQPLVGTLVSPSTFRILLSIGFMLTRFGFSNIDGSTFGESASASFEFYVEELRLADVRTSREKTIEGIILGERMRCAELYMESFTHAVGKYSAVIDKKFPLFQEISPTTRASLERAALDLTGRQHAAEIRLVDFDFPSLFTGIAASTTSDESKYVRFKAWKANFMSMRKFIMSYYKDLHGQWPPKASSKKNSFVVGGLNRLVLKGLYADMCQLYDLKADREQLTTRSFDSQEDGEHIHSDRTHAALRNLLSEFDRSSPPVAPPIPFDVPLVPSMFHIEPRSHSLSPKEQYKLSSRRLKDHETSLLLSKTRNMDADHETPFIQSYKKFEAKEAKGKNSLELADMVHGHWICMYAIIQSLPLLVVDVTGLHYTEGVEYFLCQAPSGNLPWVDEAPKTAWYGVQGGQHVVALPAFLVENGIEAVYRRSHCWTIADKWIGHSNGEQEVDIPFQPLFSPLAPPPGFGEEFGRPPSRGREETLGASLGNTGSLRIRDNRSRSRGTSQRQSIALGLERLPFPAGQDFTVGPASRPASRAGSRAASPISYSHHRRDSSMGGRSTTSEAQSGATFDDILGSAASAALKKGKPKKK